MEGIFGIKILVNVFSDLTWLKKKAVEPLFKPNSFCLNAF